LMAAALRGDRVKVWNVATLELVATLEGARFVAGFSQNNEELLVADPREQPSWWNVRNGKKITIPAYSGSQMKTVDLSPDRKLAAIVHANGKIELLEINSGRQIAIWQAHPHEVLSLAFSPTGDKLVSGSRDRAVTVWNVADQQKLASNDEHRGAVCALAFSRR